ncbi:MAG TPA: 4a-hydroxytetrahydrobiopterin dehydratase, partial [Planctomycetota bacterium]|nr:4a-hydroxytetrahydrobiopterin dehydratase [Planctomycetota bacterium]
ALAAALAALPGWERRGERLAREYRFADFRTAFAFLTAVALESEARDHHPEWTNAYDRVAIAWTTHSAGGLTELDVALAHRCDAMAAALGAA